jgi:hypothetical protein
MYIKKIDSNGFAELIESYGSITYKVEDNSIMVQYRNKGGVNIEESFPLSYTVYILNDIGQTIDKIFCKE